MKHAGKKKPQTGKKKKSINTFWIYPLKESLDSPSCSKCISGHVPILTKSVLKEVDSININESPLLDVFIQSAPKKLQAESAAFLAVMYDIALRAVLLSKEWKRVNVKN